MSKLKHCVECCQKVFNQKPDMDGYYVEPTKNQMIEKLLQQHEEIENLKKTLNILADKNNYYLLVDENTEKINVEYAILLAKGVKR